MEPGDIATWVGAAATAITGAFTASQLYLLRQQQLGARRLEREGVAVSWYPTVRSREVDGTGLSVWTYQIRAHNPGVLPIRNVNVRVEFPRPVARAHSDGSYEGDTTTLSMGIPVLMGGQSHTWIRSVRFPSGDRDKLRTMVATVTFVDLDGMSRANTWQGGSDDCE